MSNSSDRNSVGSHDLPEDRSTVLLLGVTRIPTSPTPARRPCSLPLTPSGALPEPSHNPSAHSRRTSFSARHPQRPDDEEGRCSAPPPLNVPAMMAEQGVATAMERSVDSIGTCSLDVDASADLSDWSEASSGGTLRSTSLKTPPADAHLPSYLSLACTINGYSTTTNYDSVRLSRSRDASPHRPDNDRSPLSVRTPSYSIHNNLLSPPNLVPLPTHPPTMSERTLAQEYFRSTKTMTFSSSHHYAADTIDACITTYETKRSTTINGRATNCASETIKQAYHGDAGETKSFIQQRVERLYGPGALAQGFFVSKRNHQDSEGENGTVDTVSPMKQSSSSPALPVLRHLRPEFRAQLPILSPRKETNAMQKSSTVPILSEEVPVNGHAKGAVSEGESIAQAVIVEETGDKDGHYFLKILQNETTRLLKLADDIEIELANENLTEEVIGIIRSASGKARLLASQKMQQFKGLCTNNITQSNSEPFPTTNEDLQGFWDMVMLQVHQIDALFEEIETLKANNWIEVKKEVPKVNNVNGKTMKKTVSRTKPTTAASEEARKKREAQRKQIIEERRKAMKVQSKNPIENIEIFVPESS